jgi:N-formylglutamate deformylase
MPDYHLHRGDAPLIVSLPHDGTAVPEDIAERMTDTGRAVPDTDWWVSRLYAFARDLGATVIAAHWSRYVVDLNRDPNGAALYPGRRETALVPVESFAGAPLWLAGAEPDEHEIARRVERYWQPYHAALRAEIARLRAVHPRVVLWEGHSIASRVPLLFDGVLPDFNLGTAGGASCAPALRDALSAVLAGDSVHTHVVDGRFRGGWITRHYGRPDEGVGAVQLELAQSTYLDEVALRWDDARATRAQALIGRLLETCLAHAAA